MTARRYMRVWPPCAESSLTLRESSIIKFFHVVLGEKGQGRGNQLTLIELRQVPIGACRNSINVN